MTAREIIQDMLTHTPAQELFIPQELFMRYNDELVLVPPPIHERVPKYLWFRQTRIRPYA